MFVCCHVVPQAVDPDVDRCVFIGGDGKPLGEEYTLALAVSFWLVSQNNPQQLMISFLSCSHGGLMRYDDIHMCVCDGV